MTRKKILFTLLFFLISHDISVSYAKVYIDITSPSARSLPIAIEPLGKTPLGAKISDTLRRDLDFIGLFQLIGGSPSYHHFPVINEVSQLFP